MFKKILSKAIISDLDGTIALLAGRNPYSPETIMNDKVNEPIADILRLYKKNSDVVIIIVSGRNEKYKAETEIWLKKHNLDLYDHLFMRPGNDNKPDYNLKREIYKKHIENNYEVLFVLEDRDQAVKLWRDLGLTCLQVAKGNF